MPKTSSKSPKAKLKNKSRSQISNRKLIIGAVILIVFGALGLYMLKSSSAYTTYYTSYIQNDQARRCTQHGENMPPTQSIGSRGSCVFAIQVGLNNWTKHQLAGGNSKNSPNVGGYVAVDGVFGQSTKDKVIAFQKAKGQQGKNTAPDGVVGAATWSAMLNDCTFVDACPNPNGGK